jgi:hypothetical protein
MVILIGIWLAVGGGVAGLAGLSGIRHFRRLRRYGVRTWAMVVPRPRSEDDGASGQSGRTLIQYSLANGQVLEQYAPRPVRKSAALRQGQMVVIWSARALRLSASDALTGWRGTLSDDPLADRTQDEHGEVDEAADNQDDSEQEHDECRPRGVQRCPGARVDPRTGQ